MVLQDLRERNEYSYKVKVAGAEGGVRRTPAMCAVEGCEQVRKYRCTKNFEIGGCSMAHLKLLNV